MRISFVCNLNLARSQVLSSVFASLYPSHEFNSAGLIAKEGARVPNLVIQVVEDWGLVLSRFVSHNLYIHSTELLKSDVIVAISDLIAEEIRIMGFSGRILNVNKYSEILKINLVDPQLMSKAHFSFEMAKYIKVVGYIFRQELHNSFGPRLRALIPRTGDDRFAAFEFSVSKSHSNSKIIIGDLLTPQFDLFVSSKYDFGKYRLDSSLSKSRIVASEISKKIFVPASAVSQPSKMYLSTQWLNFCMAGPFSDVFLITPPLYGESSFIFESFLAAIHSSSVEVISS